MTSPCTRHASSSPTAPVPAPRQASPGASPHDCASTVMPSIGTSSRTHPDRTTTTRSCSAARSSMDGGCRRPRRTSEQHRAALRTHQVWLFSVGTFGDTKRLLGSLARREPRNIDALLTAVRPRDYRVFAGAIEPAAWPWWSRMLLRAIGGRFGDNRDWEVIDAWAAEIARGLRRRSRSSRCIRQEHPYSVAVKRRHLHKGGHMPITSIVEFSPVEGDDYRLRDTTLSPASSMTDALLHGAPSLVRGCSGRSASLRTAALSSSRCGKTKPAWMPSSSGFSRSSNAIGQDPLSVRVLEAHNVVTDG